MRPSLAQQMLCWVVVLVFAWFAATTSRVLGQGPSDFLRRLDANGNGMLDPEEMEGRAGFFIRRLAENNPRLDLSRPIPFDRLAEEFSRMREERSRGGDGGSPFGRSEGFGRGFGPPGGMFPGGPFPGGPFPGGPFPGGPFPGGPFPGGPFPGGPGGPGGPSGPPSSPYASRVTKVEPLVPGFGVNSRPTPPSAFGAEAELFKTTVTDDDRREAERAFRYLDRNQDGKIDAAEMGQSRSGVDLPMYDKNHDGVITLNEMEYRFARRRVENERDNKGSSGDGGGDRRGRRDGWGGRDGEGRGGASAHRSDEKPDDKSKGPKSYRRKTPGERLPSGLPDWFAKNDADGDGQVAWAEFCRSAGSSAVADFRQFDLNDDGLITPQECLKAKAKGAVRTGESATTAVAAAGAPAPAGTPALTGTPAAAGTPVVAAPGPTAGTPASSPPAAPITIDPRTYDYAKKVLSKYDANGDGELTSAEWAGMSKNPEAADTDHNGRITVEEYARWTLQ